MGVPHGLPFADAVNDKYRFHDTELSRFVLSARHAVAIDERRTTFAPTLWTNTDALNANADADALPYEGRPYQQSWFPGRHSAVGGGEEDGGVSIAPLLWIAEGAARAGLEFDKRLIEIYESSLNNTAPFASKSRAVASYLLAITGKADRKGPDKFEQISDAASERWTKLPTYRPGTLTHFHGQLSAPST